MMLGRSERKGSTRVPGKQGRPPRLGLPDHREYGRTKGSQKIVWMDPAGFPLAESDTPHIWDSEFVTRFDFVLDSHTNTVRSSPYI
jgi:hypothetical protein